MKSVAGVTTVNNSRPTDTVADLIRLCRQHSQFHNLTFLKDVADMLERLAPEPPVATEGHVPGCICAACEARGGMWEREYRIEHGRVEHLTAQVIELQKQIRAQPPEPREQPHTPCAACSNPEDCKSNGCFEGRRL